METLIRNNFIVSFDGEKIVLREPLSLSLRIRERKKKRLLLIDRIFFPWKFQSYRGQFKCTTRDEENHSFSRYISFPCTLFLVNFSFHLPVSNQTRTEKRARLVFLFAEDACALLVLIKLGEHSQSGSTHRAGQICESEIRLRYCSYRCWIATEHSLPDQSCRSCQLVLTSPRVLFVSPHLSQTSRNIGKTVDPKHKRTKFWRHMLLPPVNSRQRNSVAVRSLRALMGGINCTLFAHSMPIARVKKPHAFETALNICATPVADIEIFENCLLTRR